MKCPLCKGREHVEIDLHAEGFSQDARECGDCGGIWTFSGERLKIIKSSNTRKTIAYSDFICPTCKSVLCIETDLDAFQFHEEIQECANCGTVCSSAHDHVEVIKDSQKDSFLSTMTDSVEADDYALL
jgi:Zn-finger nucleic acid-binding protein